MNLKLSSIVCSVFCIALFGFSNAKAQELEFFLMKEGLEVAKIVANQELSKPVLIEIESASADFNEDFSIIFEGADIGKATFWFFVFREENDNSEVIAIEVFKESGVFDTDVFHRGSDGLYWSLSFPIDETKLVDSDEFVTSLVSNSNFKKAGGDTVTLIGVSSIYSMTSLPGDTLCLSSTANRWYWRIGIEDCSSGSCKLITIACCSAPYFDVSEIDCEDYISVQEISETAAITIFPNPASSYLMFSNFAELSITSIEIFDVAGNLISVFASDSTVLDISNLLSGSYFVCFTVGNKKVYRAVIKE